MRIREPSVTTCNHKIDPDSFSIILSINSYNNMKFSLSKGLANMFRSTAAKLDPSAQPFVPDHRPEDHSPSDPTFAIYNDGVPSLTPNSLKDILAGINDEAMDENFAPDAQEAAELEMVDHYVQELANMDIMEDREVGTMTDECLWLRTNFSFLLSFRNVLARVSLTSANVGKVVEVMALNQTKPLVKP